MKKPVNTNETKYPENKECNYYGSCESCNECNVGSHNTGSNNGSGNKGTWW